MLQEKTSPHGSGRMGHGKGYPGGSMHGGPRHEGETWVEESMVPIKVPQKFIDHILKFKDGMAITDDQAAKLSNHQNQL